MESLSALAYNRKAVKANEMEVGQTVEGYLVKITEKPSTNPKIKQPNVFLFLIDENGEETVVFTSGNLKSVKTLTEKAKIEAGTKMQFTRVAPPADSNYKSYFDIRVDREDLLDLNQFAGVADEKDY